MSRPDHPALLTRGFRPFFFGASLFAVLTMAMWISVYRFGMPLDVNGLTIFQWHAHEMIYGFGAAVIAGFLLTAAQNWTGVETLQGKGLGGLFVLWMLGRIFMANGSSLLPHAAIADCAFIFILTLAIAQPVIKVRQKRQAPVLLILSLLTLGNATFYVAAISGSVQWINSSLYGGLYLVLGLILFMGRRVIPFFAEGGVGYPVELKNARWNDLASWLFYAAFIVTEVFFTHSPAGAVVAATLFILNAIRIAGWYTAGIWHKPLLWSLYLAYLMITLGFLLRALEPITAISSLTSIHAFAVGGVGLVTISMMPRVSLGHTGRSIHDAPASAVIFISILVASAIVRIVFTWLDPSRYGLWITLSGLLWIIAFGLFVASIGPLLFKKRIDAK